MLAVHLDREQPAASLTFTVPIAHGKVYIGRPDIGEAFVYVSRQQLELRCVPGPSLIATSQGTNPTLLCRPGDTVWTKLDKGASSLLHHGDRVALDLKKRNGTVFTIRVGSTPPVQAAPLHAPAASPALKRPLQELAADALTRPRQQQVGGARQQQEGGDGGSNSGCGGGGSSGIRVEALCSSEDEAADFGLQQPSARRALGAKAVPSASAGMSTSGTKTW